MPSELEKVDKVAEFVLSSMTRNAVAGALQISTGDGAPHCSSARRDRHAGRAEAALRSTTAQWEHHATLRASLRGYSLVARDRIAVREIDR